MSPQNNGTEPNGEHHGSNGITLEKRNAADANGKTATPENGVNGITHTAVGIIEDDKDAAPRKLCCGGGKDGKPLEERVSFFNLFRFATVFDKFLMIVGSLAMFIVGAGLPMNLYFFGELLTSFILIDASKNMPPTSANNVTTAVNNITSTLDPLNSNSLRTKCAAKYQESISAEPLNPQALQIKLETVYVPAFVSIGVLALALYYIGMTFWKWTAERQITKIRITFFQAIIRQSVGWFDVTDTGALNTRLVEDIDRIQDGVGDKIATFIQWLATFIGGFGIGFVSGPKLAGVIVCASPLMVIIGAAFSRFIRTLVKKELVAYSKAGSIAEETFAAIRTVAAFGGEEKAEEKYGHNLKDATKEGVRKSTMAGLMVGIFWTVIFSIFALAFWYGAKLVREECLPPGTILQVVFGVLIGAMSLGNAVPLIENFGNARGGAAAIYKIIDTHTEIDSHSEEGIKPENVEGNVDFCDVEFSYPARPELKILNKLNLSVSKGQTIALVGESGCGKSTTVHLLQRFYECAAGSVKVDGRDIRDYNLRWLRDHMGIVGQEPVLFAESILQNIKLGGRTQASEDVTPQQIEDACKMANCYDFIKKLPQGFDTLVGERGIQLSGGQKQRIAIARALVRNPTILLLDEATSALDTQSEKIVQDALNKASEGRTTIVIAHRLSTVKNADRIYAFRSGVVNESGTHDELMKKGGVYYSLCMRQMKQEEEEKTQLQADITGINNIKGGHPETPAHEPKQNNEEDAISHSSETLAVVSLDDYLVKRDHSLRRSSHHRASTRSARSILGVETPDAVDTLLSGVVTSDEEVEIKPDTKTADISYLDILSMNKPEWYYIVFGVLGALVVGSIQPMFALVMSEIIGRLSIDDLVRQERETSEVIAYILGVGLGAALSSLIMQFFLSMSGEKLTERLRKKTFHQLCRQEIGYFDSEENGVGVLMTRLSADASLVKGATGLRIGVITQTLTIIIASLIIAFLAVWQLTLVMVIFMPISIVAGAVQVKAMRGYAEGDQKAIEIGSKMAQEVISNIRTVTSLNRQTHFYDNYANHFNNLYRESRTRIFTSGITYAIANSMVYFLYGVNFGYGGWLVLNIPDLEFFLIFRVFACVQFGGMAIGRASANLPDYARAKLAAAKIKELFQRESLIDHTSQSGEKLESCDGVVEFSKVAFRYPSRPNVKVLRGLTVKINKGETLALVGSSGCGKSTSVSLLERFYDPVSGSVCLSGVPTTDLNVRSLRQQLGLVSQEPTLFDVSIRENIEYGDNSRSVSMDEVIDAAKQANIHNFITTLPNGYETEVGSHGTQLSGGQKQRIAIARALVRNPSVLLLDEATSALDTESEKVVQEALERAQQGRTSIIIAHRLTTVKNADKIALIDQGKVAEIGTHSQLIAMKGQYYNLINAQL